MYFQITPDNHFLIVIKHSCKNGTNMKIIKSNDELIKLNSAEQQKVEVVELLDQNADRKLFEELEKLSNLRVLHIEWTERSRKLDLKEINKIPESTGRLNKLKELNLRYIRIKKLPESIGQLKNLDSLDLRHAKIKKLPDSVGLLSNLKVLNLSYTEIKELPESIGQLKNLDSLDLSNTEIDELPDSIGLLSNLKDLDLRDTEIKELPESIGQLFNVKKLYLYNTPLKKLPETFIHLDKTEILRANVLLTEYPYRLTISDRGISLVPVAPIFSKLNPGFFSQFDTFKGGEIDKLRLKDITIEKITIDSKSSKGLKEITIRNCNLKELPDIFGEFTNLQVLQLENNNIKTLPGSICKLDKLEYLNLSGNQLECFPEQIDKLPRLKKIVLDNNLISCFPDKHMELPSADLLVLRNNPIEVLPSFLGRLATIKKIDIRGCKYLKIFPSSFGKLSNPKPFVIIDKKTIMEIQKNTK